ncbi:superfamily I DNA and RNA helicase [Cupriavidus alkaliphilus]|nr:superfamily I DNA and RNA helicase [Cupriavidus alkaliphilus]
MAQPTFNFLAGSLALENRPFHLRIADSIRSEFASCDGYVGYRLTTLGRASDADVPSFMVVTRQHGILLIDVVEERVNEVAEQDGTEYWITEGGAAARARSLTVEIYEEDVVGRLKNDLTLYDRRAKQLKVPIRTAIVFCQNSRQEVESWYTEYADYAAEVVLYDEFSVWINGLEQTYNGSPTELDRVYALLEGTFIYETKTPSLVDTPPVTLNDFIQRSLKTTFKQDEAQRFASMQLPPGPQRIRGLAGTGKTIVLSLKAAITHKKFENYKILYLFNTQSLYQHVQSLISKYYTLEAKRAPDFESGLQVLHAWGGRQKPGLYSKLCKENGLIPLTWSDVRGKGDALAYIYRDLLNRIGDRLEPQYDLILIDEAQDFPNEVFQVAYKLAKGNGPEKRIIWAYDEFQSLVDTQIKDPEELFGKNGRGEPNMPGSVLAGEYAGGIPKDFVLPNCYRTPRPVLMTAHGVALGLYTERPNEMFYYPGEWRAIGYNVLQPQKLTIDAGDPVKIERPDENSRNILENLLRENSRNPQELVQCASFSTNLEQLDYVAKTVKALIDNGGVAPEEIILINLRSGDNKAEMLQFQRALLTLDVESVIPGYVESSDIFKPKGFVTITTPFRAKGNESNFVFVLNAQQVPGDFSLRMRNAFFVAVTRARGWCYITGYGPNMPKLKAEVDQIKENLPEFVFTCPSPEQVKSRKSFLKKSDKELSQIQHVLEMVENDPELFRLIQDRFQKS